MRFEYDAKNGYRIIGDTVKSRAVFLSSFHEIRSLFDHGVLKFINNKKIEYYTNTLTKIEKELNTKFVDGILDSIAVLLPIMVRGNSEIFFPYLKKMKRYIFACICSERESRLFQTIFSRRLQIKWFTKLPKH